MKKLLSVVLALLMLAVMLPVTAMAEDTDYCTIEGITEADGTTLKHFDTLTAAAKAWRESKKIVTEGPTLGGHPTELTEVESIVWTIYGTVPTGDGAGVIGTSGSILDGGYTGNVQGNAVKIKKVIVNGENNAIIAKTGSEYLVCAGANEVQYTGITFTDQFKFNSNPPKATFSNCKFEAGFYMPHADANGSDIVVESCTITGANAHGYGIFVQGNKLNSVKLNNNQISNAKCGINVQDFSASAIVEITGNTITNLTGKDANGGKYGSAIQLTSGASFTVTDNIINIANGLNAFQLYEGLTAEVTISNNKVTADYLIWNQAPETTTISSADNTLNIKNANLANAKGELVPDETVINKAAPTQIVIITPAGDTPKTEDQKNPSTGANDMVAAAAALMAVSALGMAVLSRKK